MTVNVAPVSSLTILDEQPHHKPVIEELLDAAFGPGRFAKSSYRLREGVSPIQSLCAVAERDGEILGSIRYWPIVLDYGDAKPAVEALLLGPLAVSPTAQKSGVGMALMKETLERARAQGWKAVILVGDEPYYARVGFSRLAAMGLTMPTPQDPNRLLGLNLVDGSLDGTQGKIVKNTADG